MIDLWYAPTPNGWKVSIMLEECGLPYRIQPLLLGKGEQHGPLYRKICPTGKMPAIVDHEPAQAPGPLKVFESGAILIYLAEKSGKLLPVDTHTHATTLSWLLWQASGLGPVLGKHGYFRLYADLKLPQVIDLYRREAEQAFQVLDTQLATHGDYVTGSMYSIADIACFPWIMTHKAQGLTLKPYPHLQDWFGRIRARPAVQKGIAAGRELFSDKDGLRAGPR